MTRLEKIKSYASDVSVYECGDDLRWLLAKVEKLSFLLGNASMWVPKHRKDLTKQIDEVLKEE